MKWLLAISVLCSAYVYASDDDLRVCTDRGRIARETAQAIQEGFPVDKINYHFPFATEADKEMLDKWSEELKKEVVAALAEKGTPEGVGAKVAGDCAYQYGKSRSKMHKTERSDDGEYQSLCESSIGRTSCDSSSLRHGISSRGDGLARPAWVDGLCRRKCNSWSVY